MPWDNPLQLLRAVVQAPTKPKEWTKFHVWCVARGKHPAGRHHYRSTQPLKLCQGTASPQQIFMEWTHGKPQQHSSSKATDSGFLQCNKQAELFESVTLQVKFIQPQTGDFSGLGGGGSVPPSTSPLSVFVVTALAGQHSVWKHYLKSEYRDQLVKF